MGCPCETLPVPLHVMLVDLPQAARSCPGSLIGLGFDGVVLGMT